MNSPQSETTSSMLQWWGLPQNIALGNCKSEFLCRCHLYFSLTHTSCIEVTVDWHLNSYSDWGYGIEKIQQECFHLSMPSLHVLQNTWCAEPVYICTLAQARPTNLFMSLVHKKYSLLESQNTTIVTTHWLRLLGFDLFPDTWSPILAMTVRGQINRLFRVFTTNPCSLIVARRRMRNYVNIRGKSLPERQRFRHVQGRPALQLAETS